MNDLTLPFTLGDAPERAKECGCASGIEACVHFDEWWIILCQPTNGNGEWAVAWGREDESVSDTHRSFPDHASALGAYEQGERELRGEPS